MPALLNGESAWPHLVFDTENLNGYVAGATVVYLSGGREPDALQGGHAGYRPRRYHRDFLCDYYDYDGNYISNFFPRRRRRWATSR